MKKLILTEKILAIAVALMLGAFFITKPARTSADGKTIPEGITYGYTEKGQVLIHWGRVKDAAGYCVKIETTLSSYIYPPDITCNLNPEFSIYAIPLENPLYIYDSETKVTVAAQKYPGQTTDLEFSTDSAILISKLDTRIANTTINITEGYTKEDLEELIRPRIIVSAENNGNFPIDSLDFAVENPTNPTEKPVAKLQYEDEEGYYIKLKEIVDEIHTQNAYIIPDVGLTPGEYQVRVRVYRRKRIALDQIVTINILPSSSPVNPEINPSGEQEAPESPESPEKPEEPTGPEQDPENPEQNPEEPQPEIIIPGAPDSPGKPETPQQPEEPEEKYYHMDALFPSVPKTPQAGAKQNL